MGRVLLILAFLLAAGCGSGEPTLILTYSPDTAVISVDGYSPAHYSSPHQFRFHAPGDYRLRVAAPGHKDAEFMVKVGSGEVVKQSVNLIPLLPATGAANPPPSGDVGALQIATSPSVPSQADTQSNSNGSYDLYVTSVPGGATVSLRSAGSQSTTVAGVTPFQVSLSSTGTTEVTVSITGYRVAKRLVMAPQSGNRVNLDVSLERKAGSHPPNSSQVIIPPPPLPNPPLVVTPPVPDPPLVVDEMVGYISVSTNPWSTVYVDGKRVGNTPVSSIRVKAGTHKILMENRDLEKRRLKIVKIRPNQHLRLAEDL